MSVYYEFTISDDTVFRRQAYRDANSLLGHLGNVGARVEQMLQLPTLARLEIHGPAAEIENSRARAPRCSPRGSSTSAAWSGERTRDREPCASAGNSPVGRRI